MPTRPPVLAWLPLTFSGVAALASANSGRVLALAAGFALLTALATTKAIYSAWVPAIDLAVSRLPAQGEIREGRLQWPASETVVLADNAFLALVVRTGTQPARGQTADVEVALGPTALTLSSILGSADIPYPTAWWIMLNRAEVAPRWGAWRPHLLAGTALAVGLGLLLAAAGFAWVLSVPLRLYCVVLGRDAGWLAVWRLALGALFPAAVMLTIGVLLYGARRLTLAELVVVAGLGGLICAGYLLLAPLHLRAACSTSPFAVPALDSAPRPAAERPANPFAPPASATATPPVSAGGPGSCPHPGPRSGVALSTPPARPRAEPTPPDAPLNPS